MSEDDRRDAVAVVGAGQNGLAAAVTMARAGLPVDVLEMADAPGGGASTRETTLPGYLHDLGSAVHPMALASPFFQAFELGRRIELRVPEVSFAHPLPDARTGVAYRDLDRTAQRLGRDGAAYRSLIGPLVDRIDGVGDLTTHQLMRLPRDPLAATLFAARALEQGSPAWNLRFREETAPAMLTGSAAHTIGRHPRLSTAGAGLVLTAHAHARGWPVPTGGSQSIIDAMLADLRAHGGQLLTGTPVTSAADVAGYRAVLFDVSAPAFLRIAGDRLPAAYRRTLRAFRPGNGVAKIDVALRGPIPWRDPGVAEAPTVHLGGTRGQMRAAEHSVARGRLPDKPYVLLVQPSVIDPTRAPAGHAVLWAYTHVPYGCPVDRTEAILDAIEQHAPGVRDLVLAVSSTPASRLAAISPNFAGGDFATGAITMAQLVRRPILSPNPWRTPIEGFYLASSATAPGPSVHGLCGWYAARLALRERFGLAPPALSLAARRHSTPVLR